MKFLENDLEEIIYTSGRDVLEQRGLTINGKLLRQVKIGNYGIADLIEFERPFYDGPDHEYFVPGRITIYELKKDQVGIAAFLQAVSYAKGVLEYLRHKKKHRQYVIDIILIGKEVDDKGSFCFIENMLCVENDYYEKQTNFEEKGTIEFFTYKYNIDGLYFENRSRYDLTNKGF
jgi:hypothetical protein